MEAVYLARQIEAGKSGSAITGNAKIMPVVPETDLILRGTVTVLVHVWYVSLLGCFSVGAGVRVRLFVRNRLVRGFF